MRKSSSSYKVSASLIQKLYKMQQQFSNRVNRSTNPFLDASAIKGNRTRHCLIANVSSRADMIIAMLYRGWLAKFSNDAVWFVAAAVVCIAARYECQCHSAQQQRKYGSIINVTCTVKTVCGKQRTSEIIVRLHSNAPIATTFILRNGINMRRSVLICTWIWRVYGEEDLFEVRSLWNGREELLWNTLKYWWSIG